MPKSPLARLLKRYRITNGKDFRLRDHDPGETGGKWIKHEDSARLLAQGVARLSELQERLYPHSTWSLLAIFQAIDAAGKDGTIKHVLSGIDPQGVQVTAFKSPDPKERAHDFLWRVNQALPPRGHIGIFNRSHYEEVLVVRVHPDLLAAQGLPNRLNGRRIWDHRLEDIRHWESYLSRQGTMILKFFLHISPEEQKKRFLERIDDPKKNWKFAAADITERAHFAEYMEAYEQAIRATATQDAPWYVIPADQKWYARLIVVAAMIDALESLDLTIPEPPPEIQARLADMRRRLMEE